MRVDCPHSSVALQPSADAASHRYFTVSVEVAWALALSAYRNDAQSGQDEHLSITDVVFQGNVHLKGVWDGREYPLFALDRHIEDDVNKSLASLVTAPPDALQIINVCRACNADENWPCALYLPDSSEADVHVVPVDAMASLREQEQSPDAREVDVPAASGEPLEGDPPVD